MPAPSPTPPPICWCSSTGWATPNWRIPPPSPSPRRAAAALDAPFPTTTTVSLATIATGLPPARHGLIAYQLWLPDREQVANTIKWTTLWGDPLGLDFEAFLPRPNLWERLAAAGVEPIVLQPLNFGGTPLSRVLYRGCRVEPYADPAEAVAAALQLARAPRRLVLLYVPQIDFAAHVWGQESDGYVAALRLAAGIWGAIAAALPPGVAMVGTADHGHVDIPKDRQVRLGKADHEGRTFYGDPRVDLRQGRRRPRWPPACPPPGCPCEEMTGWWGPGKPHPRFAERAPDGALFADPGYARAPPLQRRPPHRPARRPHRGGAAHPPAGGGGIGSAGADPLPPRSTSPS